MITNVVAGLVLVMMVVPSAITITTRRLVCVGGGLLQILESTYLIAPYLIEHLGLHSEFAGRRREGVWVWRSAFIVVEGGGLLFCRLTTLVNLKLKSGNLKCPNGQ